MAKKTNLDIKQLKNVFEKQDDNKSKLALSLLDKASFLEETLKKLKEIIEEEGVITEMCQGAYIIDRENPALKGYNTTIKNYSSVIKQITDMLPNNDEEPKDDGFDSFGDKK